MFEISCFLNEVIGWTYIWLLTLGVLILKICGLFNNLKSNIHDALFHIRELAGYDNRWTDDYVF